MNIEFVKDAATTPPVVSRGKYRDRVCMAVKMLEKDRDEILQEKRRVGRPTSKKSESDYHISVRRVNFRWQRGNKIGEKFNVTNGICKSTEIHKLFKGANFL